MQPRGHAPLFLDLDIQVSHAPSLPRKLLWDAVSLMQCVTKGHKRAEFVNKVDQLLDVVTVEQRQKMREEMTPDTIWTTMSTAVRRAAVEIFLKRNLPCPHYKQMAGKARAFAAQTRTSRGLGQL
jgi:hypothetical protein